MATARAALDLFRGGCCMFAERSVRVQRGCRDNEADAVLFAPHLLGNFGNEILLLSSSCTQEACN
jgi:hypothetical protein